MTITVRPAVPADAARIAETHVRSWRHAYAGQVPQSLLDGLDPEAGRARWAERLGDTDSLVRRAVAEDDGTVVGFVVVGPSREPEAPTDRGEVAALYLLPDEIGRGTGHRLHAWALAELEQLGMTHAVLWVLTTNGRARAFYEREGWHHDGIDHEHEKNGVWLPATRYSRTIGARGDQGTTTSLPRV